MLKRIVMQLNGLLTALFTRHLVSLTARLWNLVRRLRVNFTLLYLNVVSLIAPIAQKLKQLLAGQTKKGTLPKQEHSSAPLQPILHGSQLPTVAAQLQQPALQAQKQIQRHAERTKSGKFAPKGTGVVAIHTRSQQQTDGMKSKGLANQRRQRAKSQRKKGR